MVGKEAGEDPGQGGTYLYYVYIGRGKGRGKRQ